jgi:hypothetical protein
MPTPPITLPFEFGDWTPPPALAAIAGTPLAWESSVGDDGVELLISQFRDKPRIGAFLRGLLAAVQDLEDATWSVLIGIWLDTAEGVTLDELGVIVNLPRAGWGDDTYRLYLKAQVLVLRSDGSWPALVAILSAIGITLSVTSIDEPGMAEMRVTLGELLDGDVLPADVNALLVAAKPGGVRFRLEYPTAALTDAFTFASGDVDETDAARGFADDGETAGGFLDGDERTTEAS